MSSLIGIDVGTTRIKAVRYGLDGEVQAVADAHTPWVDTEFGTEMAVDDLDRVVVDVLSRASRDASAVAGVGVTGMGEAGVLTGADQRTPLAPVRAWHNERGDVRTIADRIGEGSFRRATGLPLTGVASITKILQMRSDYPATVAAARFYSLPEWVIRMLGGDPGSELSLASRTGMADVHSGTSWTGAIEVIGVDLLGEPQRAGALCGHAAALPGLAKLRGAALTVGGHDHQTAALAAGAMRGETLFNSLGTAEAIMRITDAGVSADVVESLVVAGFGVGRTVVPDRLCVMGGLPTGMQLERLAASLGATTATERRMLADDPRWIDGVEQIVGAANPLLQAMEYHLGCHRNVLAAGGWMHDQRVHDAKRRQLRGMVSAFIDEGGAAGSAYLAGFAAGLLPAAETIDGPPWPSTLSIEGDH